MLRIAVALAATLALASCATITRGTRTAFTVETVPSGAYVRLSTGQECTSTPCTFPQISREAEFMVTVCKPGYRTVTANVTHETAGAGGVGMAGNVLIGGIIGAAVDANSGATQNLVPNPLVVHLEAEAATPAVAAPAVTANEAPATPTAAEAPAEESAPVEGQAATPGQE
jgi:hypothetical protein